MLQNNCRHEWQLHTPAARQIDVGAIPAYYVCVKCKTVLTAPEVFQIEALENQNEALRNLKGFQKWVAIITVVISSVALVVSIAVAVFKK